MASVGFHFDSFPQNHVEPSQTAVQVIRAVVHCQRVRFTVEREFALGNTVAIAPHGAAEIGMTIGVAFELVETERDIRELAVFVGSFDASQRRAPGDQLGPQAVFVLQREFVNGLAGGGFAVFFFSDGHRCIGAASGAGGERGEEIGMALCEGVAVDALTLRWNWPTTAALDRCDNHAAARCRLAGCAAERLDGGVSRVTSAHMEISLEGRVALVTGASRGIGKAIAATLAASGAKVMLTSRKLDALQAAAAEIVAATPGADLEVFAGNAGDVATAQACVRATIERFGGEDVVVLAQ